MSPQLADFLTRLLAPETQTLSMPMAGERYADLFYDYLHSVGIEHCNYGGWEMADSQAQLQEFSGTLLPQPFIEEFVAELAGDDYVQLRADELDDRQPVRAFNFGLDHLAEVEAYRASSRQVMVECARHGMEDGVALIGKSPELCGEGRQRFFGFAFGGTDGSGQQARERFAELQVAAFAMLEQIAPQLAAEADGFDYDLTERERDVLGKLAGGSQRKQIAFDFNLAVATVDMHLANLRRKLGAQTLPEAVAKGYRYGIL